MLLDALAESTSPLGATLIRMTSLPDWVGIGLEAPLVAALRAGVDLAPDHGLGVLNRNAHLRPAVLHVAHGNDLRRLSCRRRGPAGLATVEVLQPPAALAGLDWTARHPLRLTRLLLFAEPARPVGEAVEVDRARRCRPSSRRLMFAPPLRAARIAIRAWSASFRRPATTFASGAAAELDFAWVLRLGRLRRRWGGVGRPSRWRWASPRQSRSAGARSSAPCRAGPR